MTRVLPLALALAVLSGAAAWADEAIPTAANAQKAPDASANPAPQPLGSSITDADEEDGQRPGPCGGPAVNRDGKPDRSPHGQVEVGVGTNGYRHVAGVVCKPVGEDGAVVIAVDRTEWNGGGHRRLVGGPSGEQLGSPAP